MHAHASTTRSRRGGFFGLLAALCALAALLGAAATARAETVTLGHLSVTNPKNSCTYCHYLQVKSNPTVSYVVPAGEWTLASWAGKGGEKDGTVRLDVYRPTGAEGQYTLLAQSPLETVFADTELNFPAQIPVRGGDVISLSTGVGGYPPLVQTNDLEDQIGGVAGAPAVGEAVGTGTAKPVSTSGGRNLNIRATLERPDPLPLETPAAEAVAAPASPLAAVPSGQFTLGKQHRKRGTALVNQTITVSGPGTLAIGGKGIAPRQFTAAAAGPVTVAFAAKGGVLGSLTRLGKAKGKARIVFTPTGGSPVARAETVHFRVTR